MIKTEFIGRGWARELACSLKFHSRYPAVLLSSKVLHSRQLGQVDLCFIQKKIIIVEVKGYYGPGFKQKQRLALTCQWLGDLLKREVLLYIVHSKKELLP